ncbi:MAG TPA: hypothetical protein ENJ88_02880 [Phaeodactylibacter sp.]|nr:hypothetical protein [Phaeodactylibacter sp.]
MMKEKIPFTLLEDYPERCELQKAGEQRPEEAGQSGPVFGESRKTDFRDLWAQLLVLLEQLGQYVRQKWFFWLPKRIRVPWFKLFTAFLLVYLFTQRNVVLQVQWGDLSDAAQSMAVPAAAGDGSVPASRPPEEPDEGKAPSTADVWGDKPGDTEKDRRYKAYIRRFQKVARVEMEKFGIPASISMAQGLVESDGGASVLATRNNNHFGIKCFSRSCKKGHCSNFSDDHHKDFFRIYGSAWESWRAHSKLLANGKYKSLKKYGKDYKAWARGLKRLGYATDPNYANKLIRVIEKYQLYRLDQ